MACVTRKNGSKRRYIELIDIEGDFYLDLTEQIGMLSVVIPEEGQNLVQNPLLMQDPNDPLQIFGYISPGATIDFNFGECGPESIDFVTITSAGPNGRLVYEVTQNLDPGCYTFSVYVRAAEEPVDVIVYMSDGLSDVSQRKRVTLTEDWQYVSVTSQNFAGGPNLELRVQFELAGQSAEIGGYQLEASCYPTSFIHGFKSSFANENPNAYRWLGAANRSVSVRGADTLSGGRVVNLKQLGAYLTGIEGLGLPDFEHQSTPNSSGKGSRFNCFTIDDRDVTLSFRVHTCCFEDMLCTRNKIGRALFSEGKQRLFIFQPTECDKPIGGCVKFVAAYSGGFQGDWQSLFGEEIEVDLTMYDVEFEPCECDCQELEVNQIVEHNTLFGTLSTGQFSDLSMDQLACPCDPMEQPSIRGIEPSAFDGNIYVAVNYNQACVNCGGPRGAVWRFDGFGWSLIARSTVTLESIHASKDNIYVGLNGGILLGVNDFFGSSGIGVAQINLQTLTVNDIGDIAVGDELNPGSPRVVRAIASAPDGTVFFGGDFQSWNNGANPGFRVIGRNPDGSLFQLNQGANPGLGDANPPFDGSVYAMEFDPVRQLLYIGGDFLGSLPGIYVPFQQFAMWSFVDREYVGPRQPLIDDTGGNPNGRIETLEMCGGYVIAGGFLLNQSDDQVGSNIWWFDPNHPADASQNPLAQSTGKWYPLANKGIGGFVRSLACCNDVLYIVGTFSVYGDPPNFNQNLDACGILEYRTAGSLSGGDFRVPDFIVGSVSSVLGPCDLYKVSCGTELTGTQVLFGSFFDVNADPAFVTETSGYTLVELCENCNETPVELFLQGPGRIEKVRSNTTNAEIFSNYELSEGEVVKLEFSKIPFRVNSTFSGDVTGQFLLPGSRPASITLMPGQNNFEISFATGTTGDNTRAWMRYCCKSFSADAICDEDCGGGT